MEAACGASGAASGPSGAASGASDVGRRVPEVAAVTGMLGIVDCSTKDPSDFEEYHAVTAVKKLEDLFTRFCTRLGRGGKPGVLDQRRKDLIMKRIRCISADGASKERRAVFKAAKEIFPGLCIVIRDAAHALRISMKEPFAQRRTIRPHVG